MKTLKTLKKPVSLRSHVEDYLREAIMEGRFKPGERLRERELCEMLQVSRPSVREALRRLEAEKLVTTVLHQGPTVTEMKEDEATDIYAIRALMEGYAVHQFTLLASDGAINELKKAVQNLHKAAKKRDQKLLIQAKARFYDVILDGCGNALVREILVNLLSRISLLRAKSFSGPDRLPKSLKEIDTLFGHIEARNAEAAQASAHQHIRNAEKTALDVMTQQAQKQNVDEDVSPALSSGPCKA
ncbi:GntR family transcriptional regulator (plasmid) [Marinobacter sp. M3C]|jgi:DNA-binding GntR family transcriptional regulator|uniref:GntR family transcriptional regulator n=1 Tax=Marinobacter sp. M3C TaxID=2917715 RepID=UPI00200D450B|nr:GntR family transcriptional regulator [Marinobacter sp. M3C]UQG62680.1 GntR family transcriptional regulator [Marinobacter sp. M3C]